MADVRAMLRAERAARAQPKQYVSVPPPAPSTEKKRKATEEDLGDTRKRVKPIDKKVEEEPTSASASASASFGLEPNATTGQPTELVDEDEWAAFERELATPPRDAPSQHVALAALKTGATISSAPLTAEQLAAQASEERNAQRSRRDEDLAAEKEDAERRLEEEFEEMEHLESRLKRLKEMREQLRGGRVSATQDFKKAGFADGDDGLRMIHGGGIEEKEDKVQKDDDADDDDEEEDDEDDFDDGWRFKPA